LTYLNLFALIHSTTQLLIFVNCNMKKMDASYLGKKINKLNKKIHRAEEQGDENKVWWRKIKLGKLKEKLNNLIKSKN